MRVCDGLGRIIPKKTDPGKIFAVLDSRAATSATDGEKSYPFSGRYKERANRQEKVKHSRVLQLQNNREWVPGEHCSGVTDIIGSSPRWS